MDPEHKWSNPVLDQAAKFIRQHGNMQHDDMLKLLPPDSRYTKAQHYYVVGKVLGKTGRFPRHKVRTLCLQVAAKMFKDGPFTIGELAEACWIAHPKTFGFTARTVGVSYPDTRKVAFIVFPTRKEYKIFELAPGEKHRYRISRSGWQHLDDTSPRNVVTGLGEALRGTDAYKVFCEKGVHAVDVQQALYFIGVAGKFGDASEVESKLRRDESKQGRMVFLLYDHLRGKYGHINVDLDNT